MFEQVECTIDEAYNCTLHLFKDEPEDGPTVMPKHVPGIIIQYNLIKYKIVCDCIIYILYYILAYIQHKRDVSLKNLSISCFSATNKDTVW